MKRPDDSTGVAHIAGGFRYGLREILNLTPRAICGASLIAECDSPEPTPDSLICEDCGNRRRPLARLESAYRSLRDRHPRASLLADLAALFASIAGLLVAVWFHSPLSWAAAGILIATLLLLYFAPGDDESDGES